MCARFSLPLLKSWGLLPLSFRLTQQYVLCAEWRCGRAAQLESAALCVVTKHTTKYRSTEYFVNTRISSLLCDNQCSLHFTILCRVSSSCTAGEGGPLSVCLTSTFVEIHEDILANFVKVCSVCQHVYNCKHALKRFLSVSSLKTSLFLNVVISSAGMYIVSYGE